MKEKKPALSSRLGDSQHRQFEKFGKTLEEITTQAEGDSNGKKRTVRD